MPKAFHQRQIDRPLANVQPRDDDLRGCAVNQIRADSDDRTDSDDGDLKRRHHGATAHAGQADEHPDQKTSGGKTSVNRHSETGTVSGRTVNSPRPAVTLVAALGTVVKPIVDPRRGDVEDDATSLKSRTLISLAGNMLVEIIGMKLILAWVLLLVLPSLLLGLAPIVAVAWANKLSVRIAAPLIGISSLVVLVAIVVIGWYGGRTLFRLAENSFWALNSIVIGPTYMVAREALRHLADLTLPRDATQAQHGRLRSAMALVAGVLVCGLALAVAVWAWRRSLWAANLSDLMAMRRMALAALANSLVLVAGYLAATAFVWGIADATLPQPRDLGTFLPRAARGRRWRVAHLSDLHIVGEHYGFRMETGRSGPQGNERVEEVLSQLEAAHARDPLDTIVVSGDMTDAGRSGEWAEFVDALDRHPRLSERMLVVPGNHDLNIADRGNTARIDLPTSPKLRLRQMRALSVASAIQGQRVRIVDRDKKLIGMTLDEVLQPRLDRMTHFADVGRPRLTRWWLEAWNQAFPMVVPPDTDTGLGFILLNSNADTHFSFSNALGMVSAEQVDGIEIAAAQYPRACWVIVVHHHLVEYPGALTPSQSASAQHSSTATGSCAACFRWPVVPSSCTDTATWTGLANAAIC